MKSRRIKEAVILCHSGIDNCVVSHPLSPQFKLPFNQSVELCSRKWQEIEYLVNSAKKLVSLKLMLHTHTHRNDSVLQPTGI